MLLKVTFTDAELAAIDSVRGGVPRATWIRRLVRDAVTAAGALDGTPLTEGLRLRRSPEAIAERTGHDVGHDCRECRAALYV